MPVIQKTKYECFSRIVISSEVEKSSLQNDNRRMRESRNAPHLLAFPAWAMPLVKETVERSIGPSPPLGEMPKAEGVHFLGR